MAEEIVGDNTTGVRKIITYPHKWII